MTQLYRYDWAYIPLDLTWYDLFGLLLFDLTWCDLLGFRLKYLPEKLIQISSWLNHYLGMLNQFSWWLKRLSRELTQNQLTTQTDPQALIRIDSWIKRLFRELTENLHTTWADPQGADPQVLIQIDLWLKQKAFESESTHDLTLSRTHVWLI